MIPSLVALALVAADLGPVPGRVAADPATGLARFWPDHADYGRLVMGHDVDVVHEAEPRDTLLPADAIGRRATLDDRPARTLLTIRGGLPPGRWEAAMLSPPPATGLDRALVRALGSPRYATRVAAQSVLVRRGEASVGALLVGLTSPDMEIRDRGGWALEEIRTGIR